MSIPRLCYTICHHNTPYQKVPELNHNHSFLISEMTVTTAMEILQNGQNVQMSQKILKGQPGKSQQI
jgi:hypothetical protein